MMILCHACGYWEARLESEPCIFEKIAVAHGTEEEAPLTTMVTAPWEYWWSDVVRIMFYFPIAIKNGVRFWECSKEVETTAPTRVFVEACAYSNIHQCEVVQGTLHKTTWNTISRKDADIVLRGNHSLSLFKTWKIIDRYFRHGNLSEKMMMSIPVEEDISEKIMVYLWIDECRRGGMYDLAYSLIEHFLVLQRRRDDGDGVVVLNIPEMTKMGIYCQWLLCCYYVRKGVIPREDTNILYSTVFRNGREKFISSDGTTSNALVQNIRQNVRFYYDRMWSEHVLFESYRPFSCPRREIRSPVYAAETCFKVFNPSFVFTPDKHHIIVNLRYANYSMRDYLPLDQCQIVETWNYISTPIPIEDFGAVRDSARFREINRSTDDNKTMELLYSHRQKTRWKGLEDLRLFYWKDDLCFLASACLSTGFSARRHPDQKSLCSESGIKMVLGKLVHSSSSYLLDELETLHSENAVEKNWIPLVYKGELYFIYSFHPQFRLVKYTPDEETNVQTVYASILPQPTLEPFFHFHSSLRGNAQCIPCDPQGSLYLGVVHEVYQKDSSFSSRWYLHRFFLLDINQKCVSVSSPFFPSKGKICRVQYITSLGIHGDDLYYSYGRMDQEAIVSKVPLKDVISLFFHIRPVHTFSLPDFAPHKKPSWSAFQAHPDKYLMHSRPLQDHDMNEWQKELLLQPSSVPKDDDDDDSGVLFFVSIRDHHPAENKYLFDMYPYHEFSDLPLVHKGEFTVEDIWKTKASFSFLEQKSLSASKIIVIILPQRSDSSETTVQENGDPQRMRSSYLGKNPSLFYPHSKIKSLLRYPILWINRKKDTDRHDAFLNHWTRDYRVPSHHLTRIEAVDGVEMDDYPLKWFPSHSNALAAETTHANAKTHALVFSHLKAMQHFVENTTEDYALICEDDCRLFLVHSWPEDGLSSLLRHERDKDAAVPIVNGGTLLPLLELDALASGTDPVEATIPLQSYTTTLAYLVHRSYALQLLKHYWTYPFPPIFVSDHDLYAHTTIGKMTPLPLFTFPLGNQSVIHSSHNSYQHRCQHDILLRLKKMNFTQ